MVSRSQCSCIRHTDATLVGDDDRVRSFEHFYLIEQHPGRWLIRHQVTDEPAGTIQRNPGGFRLTDDHGTALGSFVSLDEAILGLYALA
jgi:hypothetical protein